MIANDYFESFRSSKKPRFSMERIENYDKQQSDNNKPWNTYFDSYSPSQQFDVLNPTRCVRVCKGIENTNTDSETVLELHEAVYLVDNGLVEKECSLFLSHS